MEPRDTRVLDGPVPAETTRVASDERVETPQLQPDPNSPASTHAAPAASNPAGWTPDARPIAPRATPATSRSNLRVGKSATPLPAPASRLRRPQRVLLLLLGVWVLNTFDLGFTLHQAKRHHFVEMNPLAARLLHGSPLTLVAYKFALLGTGTLILFCVRRHAVAELACWFLLAAYFYVGARWYVYYEGAIALDPSWLLDASP